MKKKNIRKNERILRKKPCRLCKDKTKSVDYRDVGLLTRFVSDRGKIISPRLTGTCAKHQRMISNAVKRARLASLMPFVRITEGLQRRKRRTT